MPETAADKPRRSNRRRNKTEATALIRQALEAGATRSASAINAGIDPATFYRWLNSDAAFATVVETAEATAEVGYVAVIRRAALGDPKANILPDWRAAAWWLERRRHSDYGRQDRLELVTAVRDLARRDGLDAEEEEAAVQEAMRMLKEGAGIKLPGRASSDE